MYPEAIEMQSSQHKKQKDCPYSQPKKTVPPLPHTQTERVSSIHFGDQYQRIYRSSEE